MRNQRFAEEIEPVLEGAANMAADSATLGGLSGYEAITGYDPIADEKLPCRDRMVLSASFFGGFLDDVGRLFKRVGTALKLGGKAGQTAKHVWKGAKILTGAGQPALHKSASVDVLKADMLNGRFRFDAIEGRIGGWCDEANNTYYIGDGHHRMNAALEIFEETGDDSHVNNLLRYGRWEYDSLPPKHQIRPLPRR